MSERNQSMDVYVCIDGIICTIPEDRDYYKAEPIMENIAKINKLYYDGWRVVYWTNRGHHTGINWSNATLGQLNEWGAKHAQLKMTKPVWGLIIDPDSKNIKDLNG